MDFKRIAWIFFFAFLGVNVFLYNIYHEAGSEQTVVYRSDQKIPIEKRLDSENISYWVRGHSSHRKQDIQPPLVNLPCRRYRRPLRKGEVYSLYQQKACYYAPEHPC